MNKKPFSLAAVALASILAFAGCTPTPAPAETTSVPPISSETPSETGTKPAETPKPSAAPEKTTPAPKPSKAPAKPEAKNSTVALLSTLTVTPEVDAGYSRDLFPHWSSQGNGCDTRGTVLINQSAVKAQVGAGCYVSGEWYSEYDSVYTTDPGDFDIDHMVPLKEAWGSGAYKWDTATREAYANDLEGPYSLIAVSAGSNRSKSDKDPAQWMPDTMDGCEYVARWVNVKHRWNLTVDKAEKDKILSVLSWCGGDYTLDGKTTKAPVKSGDTPVVKDPKPEVKPAPGGKTDPQFGTCKEAISNGYGPYVKGTDAEYDWYRDGDGDGTVCE